MKRFKNSKGKPEPKGSSRGECHSQVIGREAEFSELLERFTRRKAKGTSLYLCGKPGTGKTYVVSKVLETIRQRKQFKQQFAHILEINAMELVSPSALWGHLAESVGLPVTGLNKARLQEHLNSLDKKVLLIIDEFENIVTESNRATGLAAFKLPYFCPKVVLASISNLVDLPNSLMPQLGDLGCSPTVMVFPPYTSDELLLILQREFSDYEPKALEVCAKQVEKSGDARRALEICRNAREHGRITLSSTLKTASSWSSWTAALMDLPYLQKGAVVACRYLSEDLNLTQLHTVYTAKCRALRREAMGLDQFLDMFVNLASFGVVTLKGNNRDTRKKSVLFNVETDEIERAYSDIPELMDFKSNSVTHTWKFKA